MRPQSDSSARVKGRVSTLPLRTRYPHLNPVIALTTRLNKPSGVYTRNESAFQSTSCRRIPGASKKVGRIPKEKYGTSVSVRRDVEYSDMFVCVVEPIPNYLNPSHESAITLPFVGHARLHDRKAKRTLRWMSLAQDRFSETPPSGVVVDSILHDHFAFKAA